ncbi:MAG: glycoside hydrolase family 25 protein [Roseburia sp.]|nr:glycoside hydrolase family 25 protein [Roseburia sp.]MCM1243663.1 glycoside hydrolase family 25 protein [Roseburia sp.]
MRLPGEDEHKSAGLPVVYMVIGVSAFVLIMLLVVMKNNKKDDHREQVQNAVEQQQEEVVQEPEPTVEPEQKLRAEDLDFWDMYPVDGTDTVQDMPAPEQGSAAEGDTESRDEPQEESPKENEVVQEDPSTDGKHTLIKAADGTEEWVLISPYLTKNTYDVTNLSESANLKKYVENGKKISYVGIDISKHNGSVNFRSLKAAGIDFVMLRLGARGYSTGQLSLDDNFVENIEAAAEAGLDIGIYFYSQAINQEEAIQESNFVVQNLEPYRADITYPVAFDMEKVSNDKARIDELSRDDKTTITGSFLSGIQAAGYIPMIYGNKEWLIKNIDLARLQDYDVWLSQDEDVPDYPYQYVMWQYTTTGVVNGIQGDANLDICFVSYSDR